MGMEMASTWDEVGEKLDSILRLLAVMATKEMKQRDQIALLNRAGLPPRTIAGIVGTSSNTVRVELVAIRKARPRRRGRKMGSEEV
jgi:DNA-directed RNA polymerase specialized sigma24 family protein